MDDEIILKNVASKLKDAVTFSNSSISQKQQKAMRYYKREYLAGDDKIKPGRSKWVSPEVTQRVNWMHAQLMRIFTAPESVCEFVGFGPEDDALARQQTKTVNFLMKTKNSHQSYLNPWVQNGLVSGLGIVTVEFETKTEESLPRLIKGVVNEQLVGFYQQEEASQIVIEQASKPYQHPQMGVEVRDLKIRTIRSVPTFNILSVPPEDFIVSKDARFDNETGGIAAKVQGHRKFVGKQALLDMGFDAAKVEKIPLATNKIDGIALERTKDLDHEQGISGDDVEVYSIHTRLKIDKKTRYYRLTLAGDLDSPVLLDYEETSRFAPYAPFVPYPLADTLFGLGIPDLIGDDHEHITRMTRAVLDSLHMSVFPRMIVNPSTTNLDDMMNMHPGAVIRSEDPTGGISYNQAPFAGSQAVPVISSISQSLDFSTGVGPQMSAINSADLSEVTATAANSRNNASQLLVEGVSRWFADTGYRYLVKLCVDALIQKPEEAQQLVSRLTNQYVPIDEFTPEMDVAASTAFGVLSRDMATANLTNLLGWQMQAMQAGLPIVQAPQIYSTLQKLVETNGFSNTGLFVVDPATIPPAPPPPPPVDPNAGLIEMEKVKAQLKAQSDEADRQFQMQKIAAELDLKRADMQMEYELKRLELELKYAKPVEPEPVTLIRDVPVYPEAYA